jgi:hypothetical protein
VEGVGGDHRAGEVEPVQQRLERGDLLRRAADLALGRERRILIPTVSLLNAVTTNNSALGAASMMDQGHVTVPTHASREPAGHGPGPRFCTYA